MWDLIKYGESTAVYRRVPIFLQDSSGNPVTGKGGTGMTVYLSVNGSTPTVGGGNKVEVSTATMPGVYYYEFTVGEVSNNGWVIGIATATGCVPYTFAVGLVSPEYRTSSNLSVNDSSGVTSLLSRLPSTVDGISITVLWEALVALINGKATVTDNGDGTETWTFYKRDNTTTRFTVRRNTTTSTRATAGTY